MSASPGFAATPNNGSAIASATLDASLTAPTNVATVLTAGASGSRIDELRIQGLGSTVAGVVNIFVHDGSTYHLIDQVLVTVVTSSTTAVTYLAVRAYQNLVLKSGWSLRCTVTVAGLQSLLKFSAFGADF